MKTREDLVAFCEGMLEQAKDFVKEGGCAPIAFVVNDQHAVGIPLDELPTKDAWGPFLQFVKQQTNGHTVVFINEGWAVTGDKDSNKEYMDSVGTPDYVPPSQHPDRIEVLMVSAKSDRWKDYNVVLEIVRADDGITFKSFKDMEDKDDDKVSMYNRFLDGERPTEEMRAAMH